MKNNGSEQVSQRVGRLSGGPEVGKSLADERNKNKTSVARLWLLRGTITEMRWGRSLEAGHSGSYNKRLEILF